MEPCENAESVNADHERERRDDESVTQEDWSMWIGSQVGMRKMACRNELNNPSCARRMDKMVADLK